MSEAEKKLLKIYDGSRPAEEDLYDTSNVNHVAWTLVIVLLGALIWMSIALINAENQRNALMTKQCADPVFKGEIDTACLQLVASRANWWEHLWYGVTHLRPEKPAPK
ncbi:MAG: hypothetical protein ACXW2U_09255 [Telluria sp.]